MNPQWADGIATESGSAGRALAGAVAGELTKIRSLRSTLWTLAAAVLVSGGLGYLVGLSFAAGFDRLPAEQRERFDPLFATFYGLTLGQLALVVFAVLAVTGEYGSGMIRASLAAVPRRGTFYAAKLAAVAASLAAVALVTVAVTFAAAQASLGPHRTTPGAAGVPTAVAGAFLYLVLIGLFAFGVGAMLRSTVLALVVLLPLLFLGSQGLGNVPGLRTVLQYLPDQAGAVIMHLTGPAGDPRFGRDFGPWTGLGITALWTAAALLGGYLVLRRRDA
ncbi:ABC transporter permease subunit [Rhizomonospora bruguierae]|uniref:ABC transporter permease subunit n=1 Tax=Rhizomonospora bruguierae TaxID=1581705 RepID=UPI001BCF6D5F|nr:ABC transporter permease subunit [Micromonospora sp. NBRC 107566]